MTWTLVPFTNSVRAFIPVHYGDVTWMSWCLKSPTEQLCTQRIFQDKNQENIKAPHYLPFVVDTPDKGQDMPVMRKACPRHNVIINSHHQCWLCRSWLFLRCFRTIVTMTQIGVRSSWLKPSWRLARESLAVMRWQSWRRRQWPPSRF